MDLRCDEALSSGDAETESSADSGSNGRLRQGAVKAEVSSETKNAAGMSLQQEGLGTRPFA